MRVQAVRRLRERQREALAEEHEAVEEGARQLDVVVEHEQPVEAVQVLERVVSGGRVGRTRRPVHLRCARPAHIRCARPAHLRCARVEQPVEVLELAGAVRRADAQLDLVA